MNSTAEQQTLNTIQNYLGALGQRDLEKLLTFFPENVDWFIPGNEDVAPWLGKKSTKKEIRAFFELLWANTEPLSAKIDAIFTEDNYAVVTGEFSSRMTRTGKIYETLFSIHFTIEDGLIVRYRLLEDSYGLVNALSE
ncbi:ketosteroid isomerase-like protein [Flavobacterium sp. 28YEA47A]|uniref:nuclear transport factor 2 family protein n=1 Tax=Flavobacterium sp. 28YEA47A TaxID=3156276 RepID=UPI0035110D26